MKIIGGNDGAVVKVVTQDGHLKATFSQKGEALAFIAGYNAALVDTKRIVTATFADIELFLAGEG